METRPTFLRLPLASAPSPHPDRPIRGALAGYPWVAQRFPRVPLTEETSTPEPWPDLGPILDLMDL